ncbi:SPOR domain-containing protein [Ferrimonas balearica]|uniref:SPOR domain-containing protein n=1 Tax=Ferrimonas balearica TaxID=44012 RepID=UPI001C992B01|nr:SPOR domain-containing protein [Ferrimonas balearica]MBY5922132.1 SPOR domain-containing protein [Ferrimonas balearica]MBY5994528.1 SPOR domain-containing protein [Ferrimonas balearica]
MAKQLQNRIVGIVVLTALGVLFLPDLLNGEKASVEEHFATIPLRPSVSTAVAPDEAFEPITQDQPSEVDELVEDELPQEAVVVQRGPEKTQAEPAKSVPKAQPEPQPQQAGWAIRLGSFRDAGNVARLVNNLRDKGYRAYTIPNKPVNGELTVVYVGPEVSRDKLKTIQGRLAKDLGLQSQLVQYDPLQM